MKVGVIGAGACGLISAKLLSDAGIDFDVFEGRDRVGGIWIYSENFIDKHGLPIPSSSYKNLRTNLPKELMCFEGLDYDIQGISFIDAENVLEYLQKFSLKFNIESKIKFEHLITKVSRKNDTWELVSKDLKAGSETTFYYDSIFVCNGHYSIPSYPEICGSGSFSGHAIHSHYYRVPEKYQNKVVLITGLGPSAVDIAFDVSSYAKLIYLSHHGPDFVKDKFPENVIHKPDVKYIDGSTIHFLDGTNCQVETIIYCSGFKYGFPFLDESCGIKVDNNYTNPLYKQLISIAYSTMFFIGLPHRSFLFPLFELQAKCSINILTGRAKLPSKSEMELDTLQWEKLLESKGAPKRKYHCISEYVKEYFTQIGNLGKVELCPEVLFEIFSTSNIIRIEQFSDYRENVFTIIDPKTFSYIKPNC